MLNTVELWKSSFGDDYTKRNGLNLESRVAIWKMLFPAGCESVLEVGANRGANLEAISQFSNCEMYACEPNDLARAILEDSGLVTPNHLTADTADDLSFPDHVADLVFTCGVLIHVPPEKIIQSLYEMHRCARKWIVIGEYFAPTEEMIPYRGHDGAMWRRDYGSLFLDNFHDIRCGKCLFAWRRMTGLDNMTFWVMEKR